MFDESGIAQIRCGAEGLPIRINKAATVLFGIHDVNDICHCRLSASMQASEKGKARLRKGQPLHFEQTYDFNAIRGGGLYPTTCSDTRHLDIYTLPLITSSGAIAEGYLAQFVDIIALEDAEVALKKAERLVSIGETAAKIGHDLRNPL